MELLELKQHVHEACLSLVKEKSDSLNQELNNFQSAANEETKSSAGDKYETGRAMMHLEKEKIATQLNQLQKQEKVLRQIKPGKFLDQADLGSLIRTDKGIFYLSISLGKIQLTEDVFCISPVAPLGQLLKGVTSGKQIPFGGRTYLVLDVC